MNKYYKETFEKISQEKRDRIINTAIDEFAYKGFSAANVNVIAEKAGISIGSMYSYFKSKDDLFLTIIHVGYKQLEEAFNSVDISSSNIFVVIEKLIRLAVFHAKENKKLTQIYMDLATEGLSHLSKKLSWQMERISISYYINIIDEAKENGMVDTAIDTRMAAFFIDNLIVTLQYSYSSQYFHERLKIFLGEDAVEDDEAVISGIVCLIKKALSST
ncbi:MAG: TetR/AcrR family transcriptional regulator [Bacteroidales bacterium]|jgi:TetR/AcrR family transcriptional regulator|nr:TetR/AcrR family transcriptional regulator [Bacteroidales bacterium]